jgi:ubiquinol-cytochrome c reductase cytochrome c1 subunit
MSHHAGATPVAEGVKPLTAGTLSPAQFDTMVRDLTNFLTYAGEPVQLERQRLGVWVLIFLGFLFIFAYLLKKEFWKDVH